MKKISKIKAFTLAEVLIVVGVIGVVAALTITTLIPLIKDKVNKNRIEVIEKKFIQGLNLLNSQESGLSRSYPTSEDFVKALSRYHKMLKICGQDNLRECFPYDEIFIANEDTSIKVSKINKPDRLKLVNKNFKDIAGFITADGVPFIISYRQDCITDSDAPLTELTPCVAGFYDVNGSDKPNKFGYKTDENDNVISLDDIKTFGGARLSRCKVKIGDMCLASTSFYTTAENCKEVQEQYPNSIANCSDTTEKNDYYAGAIKACLDMGAHLPDGNELLQLINKLYNTNVYTSYNCKWGQQIQNDIATKLELKGNRELFYNLKGAAADRSGMVTLDSTGICGGWHGGNPYRTYHIQAICFAD